MAGGIAYETPSATTEAEMMALKALKISVITTSRVEYKSHDDDPKKMQPKITTKTVVKIKAFSGISSFGLTFAKNLDAGSPASRAKAYVIRELVVMIEIVAKRRHTSGKLGGG